MTVQRRSSLHRVFNNEKLDAKRRMWARFRHFSTWLGREDTSAEGPPPSSRDGRPASASSLEGRRSRPIVPAPRQGTFKRQQSERREHLVPAEQGANIRRVVSLGRQRAASARRDTSQCYPASPTASAPEVFSPDSSVVRHSEPSALAVNALPEEREVNMGSVSEFAHIKEQEEDPPPPFSVVDGYSDAGTYPEDNDDIVLNEELDTIWILNLSMHFRDRSEREKFFITFNQPSPEPGMGHRWRRVTVSCDYRDAPEDSLEQDLRGLTYQREKNARIYESIRDSLPDIQFYDTVTNLKLKTEDDRLHVHVTEDVNEIIQYPLISAIGHLGCPRFRESSLRFESHLSGYVYKVKVDGHTYIKKEIPGPDSVDEFLYEINALNSLIDSKCVIKFGGVVTDDRGEMVKGLLISYADRGALVDLIFDYKGNLPWKRRERWAFQIVQGLSEIHESGFVQGDFTLSNIVVDGEDDAKIIDINRRGCPVGWEPPEVYALIESNQRIAMYIGVKSDLYQLGMVLWALAQEQDDPEAHPRPLNFDTANSDIPQYYRDLVATCLSEKPQQRTSASQLLARFPEIDAAASRPAVLPRDGSSFSSEKRYIDPAAAVEREDLDRFRSLHTPNGDTPVQAEAQHPSEGITYVNATQSSDTGYGSSGNYVVPRGRPTGVRKYAVADEPPNFKDDLANIDTTARRPTTAADPASITGAEVDTDDNNSDREPQIISVSPGGEKRWHEIEIEGHPYLIDQRTLDLNLDAESPADRGSNGFVDKNHSCGDALAANVPPLDDDVLKVIDEKAGNVAVDGLFGPMPGDLAGVGSHSPESDRAPKAVPTSAIPQAPAPAPISTLATQETTTKVPAPAPTPTLAAQEPTVKLDAAIAQAPDLPPQIPTPHPPTTTTATPLTTTNDPL